MVKVAFVKVRRWEDNYYGVYTPTNLQDLKLDHPDYTFDKEVVKDITGLQLKELFGLIENKHLQKNRIRLTELIKLELAHNLAEDNN